MTPNLRRAIASRSWWRGLRAGALLGAVGVLVSRLPAFQRTEIGWGAWVVIGVMALVVALDLRDWRAGR